MLTRHKNLDLVLIRSDGDSNIAVALATIRTIILFANKTDIRLPIQTSRAVDRQLFSELVVLRIKTLSVRSESREIYVIHKI